MTATDDAVPAPVFLASEYGDRLDRLRSEMASRGLGAIVATAPSDIYWLTGFDSFGGYQLQAALVRRTGRPALWIHEMELPYASVVAQCDEITGWRHEGQGGSDPASLLAGWLRDRCPTGARIGTDTGSPSMSARVLETLGLGLAGRELQDASEVIPELRIIKSPAELSAVRLAAGHADAGMRAAHAAVAPGVTELDLLTSIQSALNERGSEPPAMPHVVLSGDRTVFGHQPPGRRRLAPVDRVIVEVVGVSARYHANVSATILLGAASQLVEDACATVLEALQQCLAALGPGVAGARIDELSRQVTRRFDRYRRHRVGYGLEASFPPSMTGRLSLSRGDPRVLQAGMVVAIAPYLYFDDQPPGARFAAVFGQDALITATGAEALGPRVPEVLRA